MVPMAQGNALRQSPEFEVKVGGFAPAPLRVPLMTTSAASPGPRLVSVVVTVAVFPAVTGVGPLTVSCRSPPVATVWDELATRLSLLPTRVEGVRVAVAT